MFKPPENCKRWCKVIIMFFIHYSARYLSFERLKTHYFLYEALFVHKSSLRMVQWDSAPCFSTLISYKPIYTVCVSLYRCLSSKTVLMVRWTFSGKWSSNIRGITCSSMKSSAHAHRISYVGSVVRTFLWWK